MSTLVLPLISRGNVLWSRLAQALAVGIAAIRDGRAMAIRYDALAHKTDTELRELGIARERIPFVVMFGHHR